MPRVMFTGADGYTNWGVQDGKVANGSQLNATKMFTAAINWVHGKHEIKTGMDIRFRRRSPIRLIWPDPMVRIFLRASTDRAATNLSGTGNAFASLLLGAADSANRTALPVVPGPLSVISITPGTYRITGELIRDLR